MDPAINAFLLFCDADRSASDELRESLTKLSCYCTTSLDTASPGELSTYYQRKIEGAMEGADIVFVGISRTSLAQPGNFQQLLKKAGALQQERAEGEIYIVPYIIQEGIARSDLPEDLASIVQLEVNDSLALKRALERKRQDKLRLPAAPGVAKISLEIREEGLLSGRLDQVIEAVSDSCKDTLRRGHPLTLFTSFSHYRKLVSRMSGHADQLLVWTMWGSPLNLAPSQELSIEDGFFERKEAPLEGKWRIVIFRDDKEVETYGRHRDHVFGGRNTDDIDDRKCRRLAAFENSIVNGDGRLFFTSRKKLFDNGILEPIRAALQDSDHEIYDVAANDLDMGIVLCANGEGVWFESGFSTSQHARSKIMHASFLKLGRHTTRMTPDYGAEQYKLLYADIPLKNKLAELFIENKERWIEDEILLSPEKVWNLL